MGEKLGFVNRALGKGRQQRTWAHECASRLPAAALERHRTECGVQHICLAAPARDRHRQASFGSQRIPTYIEPTESKTDPCLECRASSVMLSNKGVMLAE
jgi:hypothetical protein